MFCNVPTPIVPTINKVCAVSPPPIILVLCSVSPLIIGHSWIFNLAQLVSSSVALPAELVKWNNKGISIFFQYGNRSTGWLFYNTQPIDFIEASQEVYFERKMMESYLCNLQHCFMSQEGQAESYNDLWWNSHKVQIIQQFLRQNPSVGKHFDKVISAEDDLPLLTDSSANDRGCSSGMQNMHRKSVSKVCLR